MKILSILAVIILCAVFFVWLTILPVSRAPLDFTVEKGQGIKQVAVQLQVAGALRWPPSFWLQAKLLGLANKLQAGQYRLPANPTPRQLVKELLKGPQTAAEKTILIKEGMNNQAIENYLQENNLITDGSFAQLSTTLLKDLPEAYRQYDFIKESPTKVDLEGFLFPDTYRLFVNDGGRELIDKMLANFDRKLSQQMRSDIKRQGKDLYQILIMASIVEKEVRSTDDMKIVSGIFWRRLTNGQRLESCATLAYVLGVNKPQYTIEDTQIDSPFNTYRNDGLPPTPIGNPGLRAIEAAIYPIDSPYNFFLSDPASGKTIWAKNFEEHKANKQKYLN